MTTRTHWCLSPEEHEDCIALSAAKMAFLRFEYVEFAGAGDPAWTPLPEGTPVNAYIGSETEGNTIDGVCLASGRTDDQGRVALAVPEEAFGALADDEFLFFELKRNLRSAMLPPQWSTFSHVTIDGKAGKLNPKDGEVDDLFGTGDDPLHFRIGFYCCLPLRYKSEVPGFAIDLTVPEGTEVAVRLRRGNDPLKWVRVMQYNADDDALCHNTFSPTRHGTLDEPDRDKNGRFRFAKTGDAQALARYIGPPEDEDCEPVDDGEYARCCALTGEDGMLRFITFDLDEVEDASLLLSVFARVHDLEHGTQAVEMCEGVGASLVELAANALIPYFNIDLDHRISHTFERERRNSGGERFEWVETSDVKIPDDEINLRAGMFYLKILRAQNQILSRLTGGDFTGVPDHVVKVMAKLLDAQRPFCPPGLGVQLLTDNIWDEENVYLVAHETGHAIMWHTMGISFRRIAWEFLMPRAFQGDYVQQHYPTKETSRETALYEGWADFCSMLTDWTGLGGTGYTGMRANTVEPGAVTRDDGGAINPFPAGIDAKIDQQPQLSNLGERCEGAVSNFLWNIWVNVCGGDATVHDRLNADWETREHIDATGLYSSAVCDKFQAYIWRPFRSFWYDKEGKCNLHDYWDPSIRDFLKQIQDVHAGTPEANAITDLAYDRCIGRPELVSHLRFEYFDRNKSDWAPVPDGAKVKAWDYDPMSSNELLGESQTRDGNGSVLIKVKYRDEDEPDVFFVIEHGDLPNGPKTGSWSTKKSCYWRNVSGTITKTSHRGYYNDYRRFFIGKPDPATPPTGAGVSYGPHIFRFGAPELRAYVKFLLEKPGGRTEPLPLGSKVEMVDADPVSADDVIGVGTLDIDGTCIIHTDDKDEDRPDVFFRVYPHHPDLPTVISTRELANGYFEDLCPDLIGTLSAPAVIRIEEK